jgi:hypothetical protein
VIARSVVRDRFDGHESARVFSLLMLVMGLAPITAPLIGGQLLAFVGWRAIFWVLCGFGLLCFALVALALPESLPAERRSGAGVGAAITTYGRLLADRQFLGLALVGGHAQPDRHRAARAEHRQVVRRPAELRASLQGAASRRRDPGTMMATRLAQRYGHEDVPTACLREQGTVGLGALCSPHLDCPWYICSNDAGVIASERSVSTALAVV